MKSNAVDQMLLEVGDAIRKLRLHRNLSQGVIAERSGISFGAYRNLESGRGVSLKSFLAVCRTLGKTDWMRTLPPPAISRSLSPWTRRIRSKGTPSWLDRIWAKGTMNRSCDRHNMSEIHLYLAVND